MTDVWIDTDPSIGVPLHEADDGFALIQAFHSPELRLRGLSTTYGNAGLATTTRIARDMTARFGGPAGLTEAHVYPGAASARDLGQPTAATAALRAALAERPLTYLALAPLTNLATLLTLHPEAARRIERVIFVGGRSPGVRFRAGRWNPYEFTDGNFHKDNAAAAILLAVGPAVTLVPVECALQLLLTPRELARIGREGGPSGHYLATKARLWMNLWRLCFAVEGAVIFDCFAVLAATHPRLLETERRYASITHDPPGAAAVNPRNVHLLASAEAGSKPTREVAFCRRPLPAARAVLLRQLIGKNRRDKRSRRRKGSGGNQLLPAGIDNESKPFEGAGSQEGYISRLGKNDLINRKMFVHPENRKADASGDGLTVHHRERQILLSRLTPIFSRVLDGIQVYSLPVSTRARGTTTD